MKANFSLIFIGFILCLAACSEAASNGNQTENAETPSAEIKSMDKSDVRSADITQGRGEANDSGKVETAELQTKPPKTVREFYSAVPAKYLRFDQCEEKTDKDCKIYREKYLQSRKFIEDNENGYLKTGGENLDPVITMALFKRPDNSYLVGITTSTTFTDECHFLSYDKGIWKDVSAKVVPEFNNKTKSYELPRYGTKVKVIEKITEEEGGANYGKNLYDLNWKNGKFQIQK